MGKMRHWLLLTVVTAAGFITASLMAKGDTTVVPLPSLADSLDVHIAGSRPSTLLSEYALSARWDSVRVTVPDAYPMALLGMTGFAWQEPDSIRYTFRWRAPVLDSMRHRPVGWYKLGMAVSSVVNGVVTARGYIERLIPSTALTGAIAIPYIGDTTWISAGSGRGPFLAPHNIPVVSDSLQLRAYLWVIDVDSLQSSNLRWEARGPWWHKQRQAIVWQPPSSVDSIWIVPRGVGRMVVVSWTAAPVAPNQRPMGWYKVGLAVSKTDTSTYPTGRGYIEQLNVATQLRDTFYLNYPRDTVWVGPGSGVSLNTSTMLVQPLVGDSLRVQAYMRAFNVDTVQAVQIPRSLTFWYRQPLPPPATDSLVLVTDTTTGPVALHARPNVVSMFVGDTVVLCANLRFADGSAGYSVDAALLTAPDTNAPRIVYVGPRLECEAIHEAYLLEQGAPVSRGLVTSPTTWAVHPGQQP